MSDKINPNFDNCANTYKKPKIAIMDNFEDKSVFVDWDNKPDISHGDAVKRFIEEELPDAEIECFNNITMNEKPTLEKAEESFKTLNENLNKVLKNIENGKKYDAINISQSSYIDIFLLSMQLNKTITPENISEHKDEIKKWLETVKTDGTGEQLKQIIKNFDKISSKGVPIYVGAGNKGSSMFNMYTLGNNNYSVGALDNNKEKTDFSADNSTITHWAKGVFDVKKITDKSNKTGFDFTGDGTIDIETKDTTAFFKIGASKIMGTSFSTPKALIHDLKGQD